jgi:hypothetical protein
MSLWGHDKACVLGMLGAASCHQDVANKEVTKFSGPHCCSCGGGQADELALVACRRQTDRNLA